MRKSFVDKIRTKMSPWKWGCKCCMSKGIKPFLRRQKRMKLKRMVKDQISDEYDRTY